MVNLQSKVRGSFPVKKIRVVTSTDVNAFGQEILPKQELNFQVIVTRFDTNLYDERYYQ